MNRIIGLYRFATGALKSCLQMNTSPLAAKLRSRLYRTRCFIDTNVVIVDPKNFQCGIGCALYNGTYILNSGGILSIGNNSHFGSMCVVNVAKGRVVIGDHVAIGPHTSIAAYSNAYGKGRLVTETHVTSDIHIGSNVFIGAGCTLLPGCVIEDNVVVGAGAVVRGRLAANKVYVGVPCRPVKEQWYS